MHTINVEHVVFMRLVEAAMEQIDVEFVMTD